MNKVLLEDVCYILDNKRVPITECDRKKGPYPYYGANGVQDYVDDYIFDDELVLLAEDGGNFGSKEKPIAYRVSGKCWVNNHAHVLKPKENINVNYLCYSLMFYDVSGFVNGATRQKLTQSNMRQMLIPFCSLAEQQRIADELDKVSGLIEKRQKQLEKLDLLIKSRFAEMFDVNNASKLEWSQVFDVKTGSLDANAMDPNGKYPFFTCAKEIYKINNYAFDQKALLLAGNNAVGKYDVKYYEGKFNAYQRTYVLTLKNDEWSYDCFKFQLQEKLDYLQQRSKGSNTKYLTIKILSELHFIVPPIELQNQFADFVEKVEQNKLKIKNSLDKLITLKKSLMQKYFG